MKNTIIRASVVLLLLNLFGCVSYPKYKFRENEKYAEVINVGYGSVDMCKDYQYYEPASKEKGSDTILVPAGERITLSKWLYFSGYNVSYSCSPKLSFIPEEGASYYVNGELTPSGCAIELVKSDNSVETGVVIEPSVLPPNCYKKSKKKTR